MILAIDDTGEHLDNGTDIKAFDATDEHGNAEWCRVWKVWVRPDLPANRIVEFMTGLAPLEGLRTYVGAEEIAGRVRLIAIQ